MEVAGFPTPKIKIKNWNEFPPPLSFGCEKGGGFCRPAHARAGRNFHYNTPSNFCQEKCCTNIHKYFIPFLCNIPSCIFQ